MEEHTSTFSPNNLAWSIHIHTGIYPRAPRSLSNIYLPAQGSPIHTLHTPVKTFLCLLRSEKGGLLGHHGSPNQVRTSQLQPPDSLSPFHYPPWHFSRWRWEGPLSGGITILAHPPPLSCSVGVLQLSEDGEGKNSPGGEALGYGSPDVRGI